MLKTLTIAALTVASALAVVPSAEAGAKGGYIECRAQYQRAMRLMSMGLGSASAMAEADNAISRMEAMDCDRFGDFR